MVERQTSRVRHLKVPQPIADQISEQIIQSSVDDLEIIALSVARGETSFENAEFPGLTQEVISNLKSPTKRYLIFFVLAGSLIWEYQDNHMGDPDAINRAAEISELFRQSFKGKAFSPDRFWQKQFDLGDIPFNIKEMTYLVGTPVDFPKRFKAYIDPFNRS